MVDKLAHCVANPHGHTHVASVCFDMQVVLDDQSAEYAK
jgi:hypothetical protein